MTITYGDVPFLDPGTGRFPDAFAPPSVAADAAAAAQSAADAAASATSFGLSVGTVTTGAPGSSAAVTVTPNGGPAYVIDLTVPTGPVGATGPVGPVGPDSTLYAIGATSGTVLINLAHGGTQSLTLTGNATIIPPSATAGAAVTLAIAQGVGAPWVVTWSPRIAWQAAPVLSSTAGLVDVVTLVCIDGWGWYGFVSGAGLSNPTRAIVDTFTRSDSADLGYTETGEPWIETDWTIAGGRALPTVGAITTRALVDAGQSENVKVSVKTTSAAAGTRLGARVNLAGTTYYRLIWTALAGPDNPAYIQRNNGGGQVVVGTPFVLGAVAGDRIGFSVTMSAGVATIKAYRNATEIYSITDNAPPPAATYAGVIAMSAHAIDDFRVDFL